MERRHLSDALRVEKDLKGISVQEMAQRVGKELGRKVSVEYIENIEAGLIPMSNELFTIFCRCIGISPEKGVYEAKHIAKDDRKQKLTVLLEIQNILEETPETPSKLFGESKKLRKKEEKRRKGTSS